MEYTQKSSGSVRLAFALIGGGLASTVVAPAVAHADTVKVEKGQTLKSIAKEHHVTVKALAKANHLKTSAKVSEDQDLEIPDPPKTYTVKAGDTVSEIAYEHGLKTEDVLKWNNLSFNDSQIYIGDELNLQDPNQPQENDKQTTTQDQDNSNVHQASLVGDTKAEQIVNLAIQYANMGIPYQWGGESLNGFDCSGLTQYIYRQVGIQINRDTIHQEQNVDTTDVASASDVINTARPGDLLFWGSHGASYHVAIYIGNGKFVAAPQPGQNVDIETVSDYFKPSFVGRVVR